MVWNPTYFSFIAFLSAGLFAILVGIGWRRRWTAEAPAFIALMAAAFAWAFVYGIQLGFTSAATQMVWQRATLSTSAFIPPLFFAFALRYGGWADWLTRRRLSIVIGEACLFGAFAVTNPIHHLVWTDATLHPRSVSPALDVSFGPVYFVHILFAYLLVLLALGVLLAIFFRRESVSHNQAGLLVMGAGPALLTHSLYTLNLTPWPGLDLTPFVFVLTGVLYSLALFHFDLLERTPIAQRRAIELVGDGLLVVDATGRIEDANAVAERILDFDSNDRRSFSDLVPVDDVMDVHGTIRTVAGTDGRHAYDTLVSELTNTRGQCTGYAVVFRNVTDRYEYEQRLEVANRVLRHNLRNDMNIVLGHARLIHDESTDPAIAAYAGNIEATAEALVTMSEKARELSTLRYIRTDDEEPIDVTTSVREVVTEFERTETEVSFSLSCPGTVTVDVITHGGFTLALRNLIENAIEHNDCDDPRVEIEVATVGEATTVTVRDNGPGLPEPEQDLLRQGTQTPIKHTEGLGLWLTNWVVTAAGGSVSYETSSDVGTSITLVFPSGDPARQA